MGTWVIFVMWLLINWLANIAENFIDILEHYILCMKAVGEQDLGRVPGWGWR